MRIITIMIVLLSCVPTVNATPPAPVSQTGQVVCYNSTTAVIPCAGTGQDGDYREGVSWPNPRFTDHGNETVTDNLTGLMWTKNANAPGPPACGPATRKPWYNALDHTACLNSNNYLGYRDWRVPTVRELASLTDISHNNLLLPEGHPFTDVQSYGYWSSTGGQGSESSAWYVHMHYGIVATGYKGGTPASFYLWPVRTGQVGAVPAPISKTGQTLSDGAGDDGALQPGVAWPVPRFTDHGNGTVTDNLTGLVWLKNANCNETVGDIVKTNGLNWKDSLAWSNNLGSGFCDLNDGSDAGDWSLPNKNELWSLIDYGRYRSSLPEGHPFTNIESQSYWSSSTNSVVTYTAWYVAGGIVNYSNKTTLNSVWPVRSGQFWAFGPLKLSATSPDFGYVAVNSTSSTHEIKIRNKGISDLAVTSISISGTDAGQFSFTSGGSNACSNLTPTLAPNANCTILVTCRPTSIGAKSANLTVASNSAIGNAPLTATSYSTVLGTVTDYATGLPLSGATVTLSPSSAIRVSSTGTFDFGSLPSGIYDVTIGRIGYQTVTIDNSLVSPTSSARVDVWLPPTGFLNLPTQQAAPATPSVAYSYRIKSIGGTYPYHYALAWGSLPDGLTIDPTTGVISGLPAADSDGNYVFAVGVTDSAPPSPAYAETQLTISVASPLLITTPAVLSKGMVGSTYSASVASKGGTTPYTFTRTAGTLPAGLSLSSGGVFSGKPISAGMSTFTVTVTDAAGRTASRDFTLTILPQLLITTARLDDAFTNNTYSMTLEGTGGEGNYTWSILPGSLPIGITLNAATGTIYGTAESSSTQTFTVVVADAGNRTASKTFTFNVADRLTITSISLPEAFVDVTYSQPVVRTGGIAPYIFSYSGELPAGLTLDLSTGVVSGTPTTSGLVNFGITVMDHTYPTPQTTTKTLSIRTTMGGKTLSVTMSGDGSGTVTSNPVGISCISGTCNYTFHTNQSVSLLSTASIGSFFSNWSGACNGNGTCHLYMNDNNTVTAVFISTPYAKIDETYYQNVQSAYNNSQQYGTTIMLKEGIQPGSLTANLNKSITISGGYNPLYNGPGSESVIPGGVFLQRGKVVFENVMVR